MPTKDDLLAEAGDRGVDVDAQATKAEIEAALAAESGPGPTPRTRQWRHEDGRVRRVTIGSAADQRYERFDAWEQV